MLRRHGFFHWFIQYRDRHLMARAFCRWIVRADHLRERHENPGSVQESANAGQLDVQNTSFGMEFTNTRPDVAAHRFIRNRTQDETCDRVADFGKAAFDAAYAFLQLLPIRCHFAVPLILAMTAFRYSAILVAMALCNANAASMATCFSWGE